VRINRAVAQAGQHADVAGRLPGANNLPGHYS
jgi:hypothetical protein